MTSGRLHYILDGHDVKAVHDLREWAVWMEKGDRRVALTKIPLTPNIELTVSTVFLGLNHRFVGDGPPIVFETMTFGHGEHGEDEICRRYTSWDEAARGHQAIVDSLLAKQFGKGGRA